VQPDEILAVTRENFPAHSGVAAHSRVMFSYRQRAANKSRVSMIFSLNQNGTYDEFLRFLFGAWPDRCSSALRVVQFTTGESRGPNVKNSYATLASEGEAPVEKRLWQAVVLSTIQEWISGPLRYKREAEKYLFQDPSDFPMVCQSAGLDVDRLRAQLTRLRARVTPIRPEWLGNSLP
jgi:hypothetical protein